MATLSGNFIGGSWTSPQCGIPNINPSNLADVVGEFAEGDAADVDAAVDAAKAAFPAWSRMVPYQRGLILKAVALDLEAADSQRRLDESDARVRAYTDELNLRVQRFRANAPGLTTEDLIALVEATL